MSPWELIRLVRERFDATTADAVLSWAWAQRFTDAVRVRLHWAACSAHAKPLPLAPCDLETVFAFAVSHTLDAVAA